MMRKRPTPGLLCGSNLILDMQGKKQEAGAISSKMSDADQMAFMQGAANIFGKWAGAR
jgi:hypothetical protein